MFGNKKNAIEKAIKKNHVNTLIELSKDKDKDICLAAINGLASVGGEDAAHYLVTVLQCEEADIRLAVVQALGTIANRHTKAFLSAQLQKEKDPKVEEALRQAMVKIQDY